MHLRKSRINHSDPRRRRRRRPDSRAKPCVQVLRDSRSPQPLIQCMALGRGQRRPPRRRCDGAEQAGKGRRIGKTAGHETGAGPSIIYPRGGNLRTRRPSHRFSADADQKLRQKLRLYAMLSLPTPRLYPSPFAVLRPHVPLMAQQQWHCRTLRTSLLCPSQTPPGSINLLPFCNCSPFPRRSYSPCCGASRIERLGRVDFGSSNAAKGNSPCALLVTIATLYALQIHFF